MSIKLIPDSRAKALGLTKLVEAFESNDLDAIDRELEAVAKDANGRMKASTQQDQDYFQILSALLLTEERGRPEHLVEVMLMSSKNFYGRGENQLGILTASRAIKIAEAAGL